MGTGERKTSSEIKLFQKKIKEIKAGLKNPNSAIHDIYSSKAPKRDLLLRWAECLEELAKRGVYQKPLSTISTTITKELKDMGLGEAVAYVRDVLPFKYKDANKIHNDSDSLESDNREEEPRENSSKYAEENSVYIAELQETANLFYEISDILATRPFQSQIPNTDEFILKWRHARAQLREAFDSREKVMLSKQHVYMHCTGLATLTHVYAVYVKHVKKFADLTYKQASKIVKGHISTVQLLYDPKDRMMAVLEGYYGFPCGKCGSYRVEHKYNGEKHENELFCYACGTWSPVKTEVLKAKGGK